jgi:hypothetical protein
MDGFTHRTGGIHHSLIPPREHARVFFGGHVGHALWSVIAATTRQQ